MELEDQLCLCNGLGQPFIIPMFEWRNYDVAISSFRCSSSEVALECNQSGKGGHDHSKELCRSGILR